MRQLRMALRAGPTGPAVNAAGPLAATDPPDGPGDAPGLTSWTASVRRSGQPCLLVSMDGILIAASEPARGLFGAAARPGVPVEECWRELSMQPGEPPPAASLLSRTISNGSPAHSVLSLDLAAGPTTVQVMAAPLQAAGQDLVALLAFVWPMTRSPSTVRIP